MSLLRFKKAGLILFAGLTLSLTGCLTSEDDSDTLTGKDTPPATKNIVEIATADSQFSTLVTALTAAKLTETLKGSGPFTVFAPTNAAFAKLPAGTIEALLANPEESLKPILLSHVVAGTVKASDVITLTKAKTVQGYEVPIEVKNNSVYLNKNVKVIINDIMATNGVIHVIDAVIIPITEAPKDTNTPVVEKDPLPGKSIVEIAAADSQFSILVTALKAAKLTETLKGSGPFTVFAPTNEAFAKLPAGTLETVLSNPDELLKPILLSHVVSGAVKAADVITLTKAKTVQGYEVPIEVKDNSVYLNKNVKVIVTDIVATNGVIHVIDAVILPISADNNSGTEGSKIKPNSISAVIAADPQFSILSSVLALTGVDVALGDSGTFTVFAPTNDAFEKLPPGTLESLSKNPAQVESILKYHVVAGKVMASDVVALSSANTLENKAIAIKVMDGNVYLNQTIKVTKTDIGATNGVIHSIDGVLLPPANP